MDNMILPEYDKKDHLETFYDKKDYHDFYTCHFDSCQCTLTFYSKLIVSIENIVRQFILNCLQKSST